MHVFLPSYAEMNRVTTVVPSGCTLSVDGVKLTNGMSCSDFQLETPYQMVLNNQPPVTLLFHQSANVATLYITTVKGTMDYIHADNHHKATASIALYTDSGEIDFLDTTSTLKGRGNSTKDYPKRPYTLTLSSKGDLLDMGTAVNWILLANALDKTNLNNKLILDLAIQGGLAGTPDSAYVDLYLNGAYNGLYLLTEKVEVGSNRLNIDTAAGDFLCTFDLPDRTSLLRNPFLTPSGRTVEIAAPEYVTEEDFAGIVNTVNRMEQEILHGPEQNNYHYIDPDSWARRYLIDEISGNIDSDSASSYFYYSNGTFFAGPVWDYDVALGNSSRNQNPHAFIARISSPVAEFHSPYYCSLYNNDLFFQTVTNLYRSEFQPLLEAMVESGIQTLADNIAAATQMDQLRWTSLASYYYSQIQNADDLIAYLRARMEFLNDLWIHGKEFCTVQFVLAPGTHSYVSVEKGGMLHSDYVDLENTVWFREDTKESFDFSQPILEDMILVQQFEEAAKQQDATENASGYGIGHILLLLSLSALFTMFFAVILTDRYHRSR